MRIIIFLLFLLSYQFASAEVSSYLLQPTGDYGIGLQNLFWMNENACPDPIGKTADPSDFSADNPQHCHEIMLQIFYPTENKALKPQSAYSTLSSLNAHLLSEIWHMDPNISQEAITQQLELPQSYVLSNAGSSLEQRFPVILFSPGSGSSSESYENIIAELVSHGYIVIGINSNFSNLSQLSNGHIVADIPPSSVDDEHLHFLPVNKMDIDFVRKHLAKIAETHSDLLNRMDLNHVGALGQSIGARAVADLALEQPDLFQAAAALDAPDYTPNYTIVAVNIPFLHGISAGWKNPLGPVHIALGKQSYLVEFRPNEMNYDYSLHFNEMDLSTLQSLDIFKTFINDRKANASDYDLLFLSLPPTEDQIKEHQFVYAFLKNNINASWAITLYMGGEKYADIDAKNIQGLTEVLAKLPNKKPEDLTSNDTADVKNLINAFNQQWGLFFGTGDGAAIAHDINDYLLSFFDMYLREKPIDSPNLQTCQAFNKNTLLKCGPDVF